MNRTNMFLILVCFYTYPAFAQIDNIYFPDGSKYKGKSKNINQLNAELFKNIPIYDYFTQDGDDYPVVGFKLFTNKALWIMTKHPNNIKKYIAKFNLSDFFEGWEFEEALKKGIEKKYITDIYIAETLGKPDKRISIGDANKSIEQWDYDQYRVSLFFENSLLVRYLIIH
jgi:hypothetical protein